MLWRGVQAFCSVGFWARESPRKTSRLQCLTSRRPREAARYGNYKTRRLRSRCCRDEIHRQRFHGPHHYPPNSQQNSQVTELWWKGLSLPVCFPKTWEWHVSLWVYQQSVQCLLIPACLYFLRLMPPIPATKLNSDRKGCWGPPSLGQACLSRI